MITGSIYERVLVFHPANPNNVFQPANEPRNWIVGHRTLPLRRRHLQVAGCSDHLIREVGMGTHPGMLVVSRHVKPRPASRERLNWNIMNQCINTKAFEVAAEKWNAHRLEPPGDEIVVLHEIE